MTASMFTARAPRFVQAASVLCLSVSLAGCGGPTDPKPNPNPGPKPVQTVTVSPGTASIEVGGTQQLSASLKDADGNTLTGRTVSWSTSGSSVATVSASGVVTAVAEGGPVTITATSEGKSGTAQITVTGSPVASVTVDPSSATVVQGSTKQLSATVRDAEGNALSGRPVSWSSSNTAVATVSGSGVVTAVAVGGPVTITAASGSAEGSAEITVVAPTAASLAVTPRFTALTVGESGALDAQAFDASGNAITDPSVAWSSGASGIATVSADGLVEGVSPGQASIVAQVDAVVDTAWAAVVAADGLLSTAFAGSGIVTEANPGATITVPVLLDLSRVGSDGDLGSVQFDLRYDPAILAYDTAQSGVSGTASFHVPTAGTFKYSFAATDVQGSAELTLVTITFVVSADAAPGTRGSFTLEYTAEPTSTDFQAYVAPIAVGGRIIVVEP